MKKSIVALSLLCATLAGPALASEGPVPKGIPHLDHVFVIMMENHGYAQIMGGTNTPYINKLAQSANLGTNYFAVGHPSLTNYLEVVGGSNFGVRSDNAPDWHNTDCQNNLTSGTPNLEGSGRVCPISGIGMDAETPAIDTSNVTNAANPMFDIDGTKSIAATDNISGKTIAEQLVAAKKSWKSYQEDLPVDGADMVDYSDGAFSNKTDFSSFYPATSATQKDIVQLYAVKHNPFIYFTSVQDNTAPDLNDKNSVAFDGAHGLWADLASGHVPTFSFIAPNQCNDQHGRGNAGKLCAYDPTNGNTLADVNPALMQRGDVTVNKIVTAIKASPAWKHGRNAIVVLWDENDYAYAPETNRVPLIVTTNYSMGGVQSGKYYTHFSLLKSIEAGLNLPCLNHACDADVEVMSDLFGGKQAGHSNRERFEHSHRERFEHFDREHHGHHS